MKSEWLSVKALWFLAVSQPNMSNIMIRFSLTTILSLNILFQLIYQFYSVFPRIVFSYLFFLLLFSAKYVFLITDSFINASGLQHSIEKSDIQYFKPLKILRSLAKL